MNRFFQLYTRDILLLLLIPFFICICALQTARAETSEVVLQLNWTHQFEYAGYYAAKEKGYYADAGIDVHIKPHISDELPVDEVSSGRAQYGIWVSSLILDRIHGKPVVMLANYLKHSPLVLVTDASIRVPSQLRGKRIMGNPQDKNIAEIAFLLKANGLSSDDVTWVPQSFDPMDVINGKADAMVAFNTNQPGVLREQGHAFSVLDPANYGIDFYGDSLFTSEDEIRNHPGRVKRFVEASTKGWRYALKNKEEIISLIQQKYSSPKSTSALMSEANAIETLIEPAVSSLGSIEPRRVERIAELFVTLDMAPKDYNLSGFIYNGRPGNENRKAKIPLTAEEEAFIRQHPSIRVSNEFDWPPFDFAIAGQPQGFGIDLMNMLADRAGLKINYINGYTWDELVNLFFEGDIDLIHSLSRTPEREKKALFSTPYYHSKMVMIYRKDTPELSDLKSLGGKIIALPRGWSTIEFFKTYYPDVHIVEVESSREAMEYVDQGKVVATLEQEGISRYLIKKFGFRDLKVSGWLKDSELQKGSSMHFAVLKKNKILLQIMEKSFESLTPSDIGGLEQKWFSREGLSIGREDVGLTPAEWGYLRDKGEILFSVAPDRMPFDEIRAGRVAGMAADFVDMFRDRLGVPFRFVPSDSLDRSLENLKDQTCDIIPLISMTKERARYMDFTSALVSFSVGIIVRDDFPFVSDMRGMGGHRVGLMKNEEIWDQIESKFPSVIPVPIKNLEDGLYQVSSGKIDAVLMALPVATHKIRDLGLSNLKVAGHFAIQNELRVGVRKSDETLHSIMSKAVRSLTQKEVDSIYEKWVTLSFEHRFDYTILWRVLGGGVAIILVIIIWNRKLMRLNREIASAHDALAEKSVELQRISITDSLTGLYNRRHLENAFISEYKRSRRYKRSLALILMDIDSFKEVNDTFGHPVGDSVLSDVAELMRVNVREVDILGRWGGEEFMIICPETNLAGAIQLAEHLRQRLASHTFETVGKKTASFGIATLQSSDSYDLLIRRADKALYQAKAEGRNRVVTDPGDGES